MCRSDASSYESLSNNTMSILVGKGRPPYTVEIASDCADLACEDFNDCTSNVCESDGTCSFPGEVGKKCTNTVMWDENEQCLSNGTCAGTPIPGSYRNPFQVASLPFRSSVEARVNGVSTAVKEKKNLLKFFFSLLFFKISLLLKIFL